MTRGILIAGNESALLNAVCAETAKRVEQYAAALIPASFPPYDAGAAAAEKQGSGKGRQVLSWNPSSPLSARTLVMSAESRLGRVDDAILVCAPPALYRMAETLNPLETEKYINDNVKSWFFLVRELSVIFKARAAGTLALAVSGASAGGEKDAAGKDVSPDLLGVSAAASFRAIGQGLAASSAGRPFRVMGFTGCEDGNEEEFAAWLFKTVDEGGRKNSGRWHKYSKLPFFK